MEKKSKKKSKSHATTHTVRNVFCAVCSVATQVFLILTLFVIGNLSAWQENVRPKLYVELGPEDVLKFLGNESVVDHFKLVTRDGDSLLVGARNIIYNLSIHDLNEQQRLVWYSPEDDQKMCVVKGKDEEACQNYVRIMVVTSPGRLFVCGTNSFRPMCNTYIINDNNYTLEATKNGQAVCPYDPRHNSTSVFADNELYSGTVADFSGSDPIIYREPLQTEQYDSLSLNAPNFVSSFTQGDFVYFFFRETAVEYINCGKAIYSRVARVCKWDKGGPHRFRNRWTSFLKSRLNCSIPGDFPFYFNEIQSASNLVEGHYGHSSAKLIYGVFNTPTNSIPGSAVCAFSLQDIADTFEGSFKEQSSINSNWLPVNNGKVPEPRPGSCHNDSRTLPDPTLNFIKTHSLMDENVPAFFGQPILVRTSTIYRFTQIAVDAQIKTPGGKTYDVIFVGTDHGKIIKSVNAESADSDKKVTSVVIEEIDVLPKSEPIRNLEIVRTMQYDQAKDGSYDDGKLVIVTDSQVIAIQLHRCHNDKITSCSECVALQDPYCAWDKIAGKCRSHGAPRWLEENYFYQNVATGQHAACPSGKINSKDANVGEQKGYRDDMGLLDQRRQSKDQEMINIMQDKNFEGPQISPDIINAQYTVETLVMAVLAGSIFSLLVGFFTGYFCGRRCHKDEDDNLPYPDTEYEYFEQRQNVNRIQTEPKLLPQVEEVTYAEPVLLPQPPSQNKMHSPKNTLRKPIPHHGPNSETFFQFQPDGYNTQQTYRCRDNFGTLRSHQVMGDNYRRGDGFSTTRSVKKAVNTNTRNRSLGRLRRQPPRHGIVTQHRSNSPQHSSSGSSPVMSNSSSSPAPPSSSPSPQESPKNCSYIYRDLITNTKSMPLIKTAATTTALAITTTINTNTIDEKSIITKSYLQQQQQQSEQQQQQQRQQNANTAKTLFTTTAITKSTTKTVKETPKQKHQQQQQQERHNNTREPKTMLTKSVPATPVQVNPTTNNFMPSSADDDDVDDDYIDDNDVLYMPPYSYPNCSLNICEDDDDYYNDDLFKETGDNHAFDLPHDNDGDSSSLAMITPPPPYDTPPHRQQSQQQLTKKSSLASLSLTNSTARGQRSHAPTTRKYLFNNRELFNISSSNGNSSSNSLQQDQQQQTSSLAGTLSNAITPTKLSAAAAAMFAAPQLNRKWNLHRKRRRRNSSSGDSKELDKLVLQSVDWDDNDIY
ncbi:LOW QUALITY PROTEIN: semaphorin 1a [Glossina fuscipes fuscipes]